MQQASSAYSAYRSAWGYTLIAPEFNLQSLNTLAISAKADYFAAVDDTEGLLKVLAFAREKELPLLPLGGGSNVVLAADFPGVAVKINILGRELVHETDEAVWLRVGAGENWQDLVEYCLNFHYWGLENLSLIPGSAGAAPIQNIGAYGTELKDVFAELEAIQISSGLKVTFDRDACHFGYRDSIFKGRCKDQYIITSVTLKLNKVAEHNLSYPALSNALKSIPAESLTPADVAAAVCDIRRSKLPEPKLIPNAGSFFKNPVVSREHFDNIVSGNAGMPHYDQDDGNIKLAAGWLIEQAGWKGREFAGALTHKDQALVITNPDRVSGRAVLSLAEKIQSSVFDKFSVNLEVEPRIYP